MRTITLIAALLASASVQAETPWEAYLRSPSSSAAAAVRVAGYSIADPDNRRFESDLPVLENEVAAGDPESTALAVRLHTQFGNAAAIAEYLSAIIGRSIRPNPGAYLAAISGDAGCLGVVPSGDLFVDRDEARVAEAFARLRALQRVHKPQLRKKRDECVAVLSTVR